MALTECRECGRRVSTEAATCPSCGAPEPAAVPEAVPSPEESKAETREQTISPSQKSGKLKSWVAIVIVCIVTYFVTGFLLVLLLRAGIIEPFTPTLRLRPTYYIVTWVVLSYVALRLLGLTGRKADEAKGENTADEQAGS